MCDGRKNVATNKRRRKKKKRISLIFVGLFDGWYLFFILKSNMKCIKIFHKKIHPKFIYF